MTVNLTATLLRLILAAGLVVLVHAQTGATLLGLLVLAFLLTVLWTPARRKAVS